MSVDVSKSNASLLASPDPLSISKANASLLATNLEPLIISKSNLYILAIGAQIEITILLRFKGFTPYRLGNVTWANPLYIEGN